MLIYTQSDLLTQFCKLLTTVAILYGAQGRRLTLSIRH